MYPKEDGKNFWIFEICINDESCQQNLIHRGPHSAGDYPYEYGDSWIDLQLYLPDRWYPPLKAAIIHSFGINIGKNHFKIANFYSTAIIFYRSICNSVPTETRIIQGHQLCWHWIQRHKTQNLHLKTSYHIGWQDDFTWNLYKSSTKVEESWTVLSLPMWIQWHWRIFAWSTLFNECESTEKWKQKPAENHDIWGRNV